MKAVFPFWPRLSDSRLTRRLGAATSVADCRPHRLQSVCDVQIVSTVDLKKLQKPQGTTFLMKLDVVHILGVFSNAMQITFVQMCLRQDVFPAARIGNVFCVESGGKDGMRLTGREFPLLEKRAGENGRALQCRSAIICKARRPPVAVLGTPSAWNSWHLCRYHGNSLGTVVDRWITWI